jgi:hypothetical protein
VSEISSSDWTWINAAADRFERAWKQRPRPRIEDYLAVVAGEPVIYSVGPDGDDDGLKDADLGRASDGDFLFRLPKSAAPSRR